MCLLLIFLTNRVDVQYAVRTYEQVSVSSGVGRTGCCHEYKSLRKRDINFISKTIDKLDQWCAGEMFNFNFVCIALVQNS